MAVVSLKPVLDSRKEAHPLMSLAEEDIDFIAQFVLCSGSLKDMAQLYRVSYPTIRASLDRVIANLGHALGGSPPDPMTDLLADLVERGELKVSIAKSIRALHRKSLESRAVKGEIR